MAGPQPQSTLLQSHDNASTSEYSPGHDDDLDENQNDDSQDNQVKWRFHRQQPSTNATFEPAPPIATLLNRREDCRSNITNLDTTSNLAPGSGVSPQSSPLGGLRIQTDINHTSSTKSPTVSEIPRKSSVSSNRRPSRSAAIPIARTPSVKRLAESVGSASIGSAPSSAISSPMLNALSDVTPLPSPLLSGDSPGPWKKLTSRPVSRDLMHPVGVDSALVTANGELISTAISNQQKRRAYHGLTNDAQHTPSVESHTRNRSLSEYTPETVHATKPRNVTVSGSHAEPQEPTNPMSVEPHMRREPHLAVQRGLAPEARPPTPPSSRAGADSSDSDSSLSNAHQGTRKSFKRHYEFYDAYTRDDQKRRRWRGLKSLGQGTFSKVILATSQAPEEDDTIQENVVFNHETQLKNGILSPTEPEPKIDRKKLVAIKICEHGPKGGASEERVEMSLKRELEIMKTIHHPSLVDLKAWNIEETRAILVLSYCPGGDLFEVASQRRDVLIPSLLRRMIAELVGAIQYLHERHIVHRDIKLENVLVNLPPDELSKPTDWATYPYSVITLTDLGLSRRVADDEKLTTRCGSDDYAAPEVIMGQAYDGRAVDAWSLGVLVYALLEARLPFDPNPAMSEGHRMRSRTSHRIARVEWCWVEYAGEDGDHEADEKKFEREGLLGAMHITEGLLKRARSRWSVDKVGQHPWIKDAVHVDGGLKFREEIVPQEV